MPNRVMLPYFVGSAVVAPPARTDRQKNRQKDRPGARTAPPARTGARLPCEKEAAP